MATTTAATTAGDASAAAAAATTIVAVTGAAGYIASQIVRLLLERGVTVHGTARSLQQTDRLRFLHAFPGAAERLKLFEADLEKPGSHDAAFAGATIVVHTTTPYKYTAADPEAEIVRPAVDGTLDVLRSAAKAGVRRVVLTSSCLSVAHFFSQDALEEGRVYTGADWNTAADIRFPYPYSKVLAERAAFDFVAKHNAAAETAAKPLELIPVLPGLVVGPLLTSDSTTNQSTKNILNLLNGTTAKIPPIRVALVDVRNVAEAHVAAAFAPASAVGQRFIVQQGVTSMADIVDELRRLLPDNKHLPTEHAAPGVVPKRIELDNTPAREILGIKFYSVHDSLKAMVDTLRERNLLPS